MACGCGNISCKGCKEVDLCKTSLQCSMSIGYDEEGRPKTFDINGKAGFVFRGTGDKINKVTLGGTTINVVRNANDKPSLILKHK